MGKTTYEKVVKACWDDVPALETELGKIQNIKVDNVGNITITFGSGQKYYIDKRSGCLLEGYLKLVDHVKSLHDALDIDADTVDDIHASITAVANKLLALNANSKLPASIEGDADTVDGSHASAFAITAKGVTNGDSHDHDGGDGASIKKIIDADGDTGINVEETTDKDEIQGKVAGVGCLRFYNDGIEEKAKNSACRMYPNTPQSILATTWTKIQLNTKDYDVQNEGDNTTNYRITVKKAGKYSMSGGMQIINLADQKRVTIAIRKNGVEFLKQAVGVSGISTESVMVADTSNFAANDYLELWAWHNDTVSRNIQSGSDVTWLSVAKID